MDVQSIEKPDMVKSPLFLVAVSGPIFLTPVFALLFSSLLLGEKLSTIQSASP